MYSFNSLLSVFFSSWGVGWSDLAAQTYKHTNNKPTSVMVNCHHVLMWCLVSAILLCWRSSCFLPAPHCLFPPHKQLSMYPAMWWLVWSIKRFTNSLIFWRGGVLCSLNPLTLICKFHFENFDIMKWAYVLHPLLFIPWLDLCDLRWTNSAPYRNDVALQHTQEPAERAGVLTPVSPQPVSRLSSCVVAALSLVKSTKIFIKWGT